MLVCGGVQLQHQPTFAHASKCLKPTTICNTEAISTGHRMHQMLATSFGLPVDLRSSASGARLSCRKLPFLAWSRSIGYLHSIRLQKGVETWKLGKPWKTSLYKRSGIQHFRTELPPFSTKPCISGGSSIQGGLGP